MSDERTFDDFTDETMTDDWRAFLVGQMGFDLPDELPRGPVQFYRPPPDDHAVDKGT